MQNFWLTTALVLLAVLPVFGVTLGMILMRALRVETRLRAFGCFLYSGGLWILIRCIIGGIGAVLILAVLLWDKWKELQEDDFKKLVKELQGHFGLAWLIAFALVIILLELIGKKLWELSSKHQQVARIGFWKMFRSRVPKHLPTNLNNSANAVLAYRAVWKNDFDVRGVERVDGWELSDLQRRVRLIYFSPVVTSITPPEAVAGTTVMITGEGFTEAKGVRFGTVRATTITVDSDAQISVTVPSRDGVVELYVISCSGIESATSAASKFKYK